MKKDMKKKTGLILGGFLLLSLVFVVGIVMAVATDSTAATVSVNEFLSVTLSNTPVSFTDMNPGQTLNATLGAGFPLNATIGPESNVNADIGTKADNANFVSTSSNFPVSNMEWSATSTFPGIGYTTNDAQVCSAVTAGSDCTIFHQLTIPSNQPPEVYTVGITITATAA